MVSLTENEIAVLRSIGDDVAWPESVSAAQLLGARRSLERKLLACELRLTEAGLIVLELLDRVDELKRAQGVEG